MSSFSSTQNAPKSPARKSVKVVSYTLHSTTSNSQPAVCAPAPYVMPGSPNIDLRLDTSLEPTRMTRGLDRTSFNIPELHSPSGK